MERTYRSLSLYRIGKEYTVASGCLSFCRGGVIEILTRCKMPERVRDRLGGDVAVGRSRIRVLEDVSLV